MPELFVGGWVIEILDCVRSRGDPLVGRTTVTMLAGDRPLSDRPPARLPEAVFLLFLRSTGDPYALINSQGSCVQGEDHVVNSLRDPRDPDSDLDRELASHPTLSSLIDYVRTVT